MASPVIPHKLSGEKQIVVKIYNPLGDVAGGKLKSVQEAIDEVISVHTLYCIQLMYLTILIITYNMHAE